MEGFAAQQPSERQSGAGDGFLNALGAVGPPAQIAADKRVQDAYLGADDAAAPVEELVS